MLAYLNLSLEINKQSIGFVKQWRYKITLLGKIVAPWGLELESFTLWGDNDDRNTTMLHCVLDAVKQMS